MSHLLMRLMIKLNTMKIQALLPLIIALTFLSCKKESSKTVSEAAPFKVSFEEFTLDNGLKVILHQDHSDPVVAVALTAHVGSAREKEGRTGFAHLFEHLLFLESENLGKGGLDKMSARVGGSGANGSTSRDRTNYFQTVPKDALEKMIWAEADKLGYFINTVTEPVLAKEKQVVKNEKRQSIDNRPYGHQWYVTGKNLYPKDHPYNWQVIGSLEDLQNASLSDVKEFFRHWYVPNNVTLTIAGDFDEDQAKTWVKKYFDEIPKGEKIAPLEKKIPTLDKTKSLFYEDNFARLPQLTMTWPVPEEYNPDTYALQVLSTYLSEGKEAPLNEVLVDEMQIATNPYMGYDGSELAGEFFLMIRGNLGVDLDSVQLGVQKAFTRFEENGISENALERIKAKQETEFYSSLSSVLGKGFQLAQYEIFAGDPGYINEDVKKIQAVTTADVMRVYEKYVKGKYYVATSFVPKGQPELALTDAIPAEVVEEPIVEGAEEAFDPNQMASYEHTPSSFDRAVEPPYGASPELHVPEIWEADLANGMHALGIDNTEVPLVNFLITIKGGQLLDPDDKPGVANLTAAMLTKGTANKTTAELEAAIDLLGASINISATTENVTINGTALARNYTQTINLVKEMVLEPRWDSTEFKLLKKEVLTQLEQEKSDPYSLAQNAFAKAVYGKNSNIAKNRLGTPESVAAITIADLKNYYAENLSPSKTKVHIVGAINKTEALNSLEALAANWPKKEVNIPVAQRPDMLEEPIVYFIDVPSAKQSQLRIGYPALAANDSSYFPATVANYRLGGGGFASELTQQLRETKGYTYGVRSQFKGSNLPGEFVISSGVRSNVTYESTALIRDILKKYPSSLSENDLNLTQDYFVKSSARAFETPKAKLNYLTDLSDLGYEPDYMVKQQQQVKGMTLEELQEVAKTYMDPDKMIYVIVGDAETQYEKLKELNLGEVHLVDENLDPITKKIKD